MRYCVTAGAGLAQAVKASKQPDKAQVSTINRCFQLCFFISVASSSTPCLTKIIAHCDARKCDTSGVAADPLVSKNNGFDCRVRKHRDPPPKRLDKITKMIYYNGDE